MDKVTVVQRLEHARARIAALGVVRIALFGSVVRGEAGADSDVDLLVEFDPERKSIHTFMALADLLENLLHRPVDLVTTEGLSPFIGPHILREAEDVLRIRPSVVDSHW
ncbi:MAG TPA: nucleotidyltransferase family protein [Longimicrobiaceae bacterium]|nr:nucleotidyltransferase family protein [Longimicrobiaceae bacterium]